MPDPPDLFSHFIWDCVLKYQSKHMIWNSIFSGYAAWGIPCILNLVVWTLLTCMWLVYGTPEKLYWLYLLQKEKRTEGKSAHVGENFDWVFSHLSPLHSLHDISNFNPLIFQAFKIYSNAEFLIVCSRIYSTFVVEVAVQSFFSEKCTSTYCSLKLIIFYSGWWLNESIVVIICQNFLSKYILNS